MATKCSMAFYSAIRSSTTPAIPGVGQTWSRKSANSCLLAGASLLAVDGASTEHVFSQLRRVPHDASHLVLSGGGNDALTNSNVLYAPAHSASQTVAALAQVSRSFEEEYRLVIAACRQLPVPLTLCTIYNGCFPDSNFQRLASTALMVFNDVILRVGIEFGLTMIDLRFVCSSVTDDANPIEPSSRGGAKIARAIVNLVTAGNSGTLVPGS